MLLLAAGRMSGLQSTAPAACWSTTHATQEPDGTGQQVKHTTPGRGTGRSWQQSRQLARLTRSTRTCCICLNGAYSCQCLRMLLQLLRLFAGPSRHPMPRLPVRHADKLPLHSTRSPTARQLHAAAAAPGSTPSAQTQGCLHHMTHNNMATDH